MFTLEFILNLLTLVSLLTAVFLVLIIISKNEKIKDLDRAVSKLKRSLEEMDEQAKLIVRTDIELNKIQEELDKKMNGLYTLQSLSRSITNTLEEKQVFKKITPGHLEELGFEKACAFLWNAKDSRFTPQLNIGYMEDEIQDIVNFVDASLSVYQDLIKSEKSLSSVSLPEDQLKDNIKHIFKVYSFVISPILPKEGMQGFLFAGTEKTDAPLTEGDAELITILANQLGQTLENARLFEKTWRTQQELEKRVEERTHELTLALEEVKKISKRKTDFISSVSHELRTPLTSVKGYASILLEEKLGALPAAVKERLEKINHHSDELVHMVNDLLDISRIESGKVTMKIELQKLQDIVATATDLISIQCRNKNITLVEEISKDIPAVMADRSQIERVFINLLGNAVKFTPQNGKITVKANRKEGLVQVDISDTGIGIPSDALTKIFDEFYRVENEINQQVKGTGLGLSLVRHIVEAHHGNIWVESSVGKGTTFSFTLPLQ